MQNLRENKILFENIDKNTESIIDVSSSVLKIQIEGSGQYNILIQGKIHKKCERYFNIVGINSSTMDAVYKISEAGIYIYDVSGYNSIKIIVDNISSAISCYISEVVEK